MAYNTQSSGADFLNDVERMAGEGFGKGEIAQRLGFKNTTTFSSWLVRASQKTGKPIPAFREGFKSNARLRVEAVEIRPRGRGQAFGVNIPQEPLERLGAKPGDTLSVTVGRRRIKLALARAGDAKAAPAAPRKPRLIKRRTGD
ncbi:MAG: hypothetical protein HY342_07875 [Candidatus Lambdaproteobacteria bacterium]|nr:hypothetical protein [Candidatus Lambdaproteobacteria bacterium]